MICILPYLFHSSVILNMKVFSRVLLAAEGQNAIDRNQSWAAHFISMTQLNSLNNFYLAHVRGISVVASFNLACLADACPRPFLPFGASR